MPNILLSGPAGAGKSQEAKRLRDANPGPSIIIDFQSLYAAISGDVRDPGGKYPLRDERLLPTVQYAKQALITAAVERQIDAYVTNSDGDEEIRKRYLARLGPGARERIIDPGRVVVTARLSSRRTGRLSGACRSAVDRWYRRLR